MAPTETAVPDGDVVQVLVAGVGWVVISPGTYHAPADPSGNPMSEFGTPDGRAMSVPLTSVLAVRT